MSKVVQLNVLVSSRESQTTFHDAADPVVPALAGGSISSYPSSIVATFGKGAPADLEYYLKGEDILYPTYVDTSAPWTWDVASWAEISTMYQAAFGAAPTDPFTVTVAIKSITTDHVEWAEADYTFASS